MSEPTAAERMRAQIEKGQAISNALQSKVLLEILDSLTVLSNHVHGISMDVARLSRPKSEE